MYFMEHSYQYGFSISTNPERALIIEGKKQALLACEHFSKASGLQCEIEKSKPALNQ
jgi:hypothetical protein